MNGSIFMDPNRLGKALKVVNEVLRANGRIEPMIPLYGVGRIKPMTPLYGVRCEPAGTGPVLDAKKGRDGVYHV